jgi:flagellar hook protein FlgE
MFDSIYVGLTGLLGFSTGLNNVSNNIANVNTPGFKATQLQFKDLFYQSRTSGSSGGDESPLSLGAGLDTGPSNTVFSQGELQQTGNDLDAAIDGTGFFILRKDGGTFYTRAGQFKVDDDGFLLYRVNDARVAGLAGAGGLQDINVSGYRTVPAKPTTEIRLVDNLSTGDDAHNVSNVSVFDAQGGNHNLIVALTNNSQVTPSSWLLQVKDEAGNTISNGEIRFNGDGSPQAGFNTHVFTFSAPGATPQTITLNFGNPGSFSGATNFSAGTDSTLKVQSQDGLAAGSLTKLSFDADGFLVTEYTNGQVFRRDRLALASFAFLPALEKIGDNLFVNRTGQDVRIGAAGQSEFGRVSGGHIERSNVDLSQAFTELIIIQRGFQASSQVISTSNEMIQQLFDIRSKA